MNFADNLLSQMNDPNCSMLSGMMIGQLNTLKISWFIISSYFIFKLIDVLAFEPIMTWIKNKVFKKKHKEGES